MLERGGGGGGGERERGFKGFKLGGCNTEVASLHRVTYYSMLRFKCKVYTEFHSETVAMLTSPTKRRLLVSIIIIC